LGGGEPLMSYHLQCWMQAPTIEYSVPSGDAFGSSVTAGVLVDDTVTLYDCGGNPKYSIEERVYHATGKANPQICEKYRSCDGVVWLQYVIYDYADGREVAKTPYLSLFQDRFEVQDKLGEVIATVSRGSEWTPTGGECGESRKWIIEYAVRDKPGAFSNPTEQWPIAEMVTMISVRDLNRRPSGFLAPTTCELKSILPELVLVFLLAALVGSIVILWLRKGLVPCRNFMFDLEDRVCPKRMRLPSRYEDD